MNCSLCVTYNIRYTPYYIIITLRNTHTERFDFLLDQSVTDYQSVYFFNYMSFVKINIVSCPARVISNTNDPSELAKITENYDKVKKFKHDL